MRRSTETAKLLEVLCRHRVEFIVVGMTAGVLQGAPLSTFDLDIVYSRAGENLPRLLAALREVGAEFKHAGGRHIAPNESHLESPGHKLLETALGELDVLGTIDMNLGYQELLSDCVTLRLDGFEVRVLSLRRLIEVKERAGRPKDLAAVPVLRSTLERSEAKKNEKQ
ncbi:MAG: hypothetical protein L6Q84_26550 [Polyangiaceae bacterium]|nr:hypothetical protein [Polyangiaceae bacterium]